MACTKKVVQIVHVYTPAMTHPSWRAPEVYSQQRKRIRTRTLSALDLERVQQLARKLPSFNFLYIHIGLIAIKISEGYYVLHTAPNFPAPAFMWVCHEASQRYSTHEAPSSHSCVA